MSRSIHNTRRDYHLERRYAYKDNETKQSRLKTIQKDLEKKRSIKKQKRFERTHPTMAPGNFTTIDPESIPIKIIDSGPYIHFPVSAKDIIGVLQRLPHNGASGLHSITLCLGKEYQEKSSDDSDDDYRDPFTGRICSDEEGPIYFPPVLGTYYIDTSKIFIYGYVYNFEEINLNILEPFLRIKMLDTLVHEIAHHDDYMRRMGRGRWMGLNEWRSEDYAEEKQKEWGIEAVVPYLLETYPEQYNLLSQWLKSNGGVDIPLTELVGQLGSREIDGLYRMSFNVSSAVKDLIKNVISGKPKHYNIIEFAQDLHYADHYEECLTALDRLLLDNPFDSKALGIKADTFIHLENFESAEVAAQRCLSVDPNNIDAIDALCDVNTYRCDWKALRDISSLGIEASKDDSWLNKKFIETKILAYLHLRNFEGASTFCAALTPYKSGGSNKEAFEALIAFLTADVNAAQSICGKILSQDRLRLASRAILKAIINKIAEQNNSAEKKQLSEFEANYLKCNGISKLLGTEG